MRNYGFTLAETLITLGIIGVVAALTIPTLITNYQKHSYYTQFMKARSVIENALRLYANDHDCPTNEPLCNPENDVIEEFSRYFKGATILDDTNYKKICKGYDKLPISWDFKNIERNVHSDICDGSGDIRTSKYNGFVTLDGLLINLQTDIGDFGCSLVDVNGPDSGPNIAGRDIFHICLFDGAYERYCGNLWGMTKECMLQREHSSFSHCFNDPVGSAGETCGARLIKEGKMTY